MRTSTLRKSTFGLCVHTTGRSLTEEAAKKGEDPFDYAMDYYSRAKYFPHYVIGFNGDLGQILDESQKALHVGLSKAERIAYFSGDWKKHAGPIAVALWKKQWPRFKTPMNLYPGNAPNDDYIGVELTPLIDEVDSFPSLLGRGWTRRKGTLFTQEQHDAVVKLAMDIGDRYDFPKKWGSTPRLVGHEDVGLIDRSDSGGGWDPGALRKKPYFDMQYVRDKVNAEYTT